MKEFFVFYFLLIFLIIILIFTILFYSDSHTRILVPGQLKGYYGIEHLTSSFKTLAIEEKSDGDSNSFSFQGSGKSKFEFGPLTGDQNREIKGTLVLLMGSDSKEGDTISLKVTDNGKTVGEESVFFIPYYKIWGLNPVRLSFNAPSSETTHNFSVEGKKISSKNNLILNSSYLSYF